MRQGTGDLRKETGDLIETGVMRHGTGDVRCETGDGYLMPCQENLAL